MALAELDRPEEAISRFERAVALDPGNAVSRANLERAFDDAIPPLEKEVARNPGSAQVHSQLGYALANRNRVAQGILHLQQAIQISHGLVEARYFLGAALALSGRRAEALAQWHEALRLDPDNLRVLNDTSWMLATSADAALRNGAEAIALGEHAVALTSGHQPLLLATLAAAYAEAGRFDKAVDLEERATDLAAQQGNFSLSATLRSRVATLQAKKSIRQQ
jgi:tetratricopeptide (TPR) repeat protein